MKTRLIPIDNDKFVIVDENAEINYEDYIIHINSQELCEERACDYQMLPVYNKSENYFKSSHPLIIYQIVFLLLVHLMMNY